MPHGRPHSGFGQETQGKAAPRTTHQLQMFPSVQSAANQSSADPALPVAANEPPQRLRGNPSLLSQG